MKLLKDRQFENKAHIRIYMQLSVNEIHFSRGTFFMSIYRVVQLCAVFVCLHVSCIVSPGKA